jgi:hypothetical protein
LGYFFVINVNPHVFRGQRFASNECGASEENRKDIALLLARRTASKDEFKEESVANDFWRSKVERAKREANKRK